MAASRGMRVILEDVKGKGQTLPRAAGRHLPWSPQDAFQTPTWGKGENRTLTLAALRLCPVHTGHQEVLPGSTVEPLKLLHGPGPAASFPYTGVVTPCS